MSRVMRAAALVLVVVILGLAGTARAAESGPLTLGVLPYLPAADLHQRFAPLAHYLGARLGRPMVISVATNNDALVRDVGEDKVDLAYIGPAPYIKMVGAYGAKHLLGRLEVNGRPTYTGMLVVRSDSPVQTVADLRGKKMAAADRVSTAGFVLPHYLLRKAGLDVADLNTVEFVGGHKNVALGVLFGAFDVGGLKNEVFEEYRDRGLRALAVSPAVSEQVFIATHKMDPAKVDQLRQAMADLGRHPAGLSVLGRITPGVTGLAPVTDADVDDLRGILRELERGGT